ncbi:MAG: cyclopropane-fatty-acyl-phospholipid synthase [Candidatus Dactylopiibacterium carminicum]|uniref:Cyclopropane-fatty-acyl-phospholipid synthase n=1 Tax=Candidatus Dactylopiibacterium carminicum TaxID=857335 RepID=A0A272EX30_9RHOO|nr:cyclopropane fatty acyl phospholipid synthase [Candidatus Dactylopiibacterium carminicum]KAF7600269.1 cyclopropane-fatty-acyl-phospholipid synthase [Candidatus Dactylopiibacterium carminicum]PAS94678.1 MAG: cyclopropane-fatty-acyl-phospholipid synthase [Candidatus Dactylopiibacterium carminicum]PAS96966.1 MAG: cyclopropane-fatty-acyl-phospholipid synthase [Candidatus Dactylopiibacterium carminicum]PAT00268.1 MAG: cyclopropane-fatty-acyl-phospholipid synthase [Candidatus Dactylopiibacterium c
MASELTWPSSQSVDDISGGRAAQTLLDQANIRINGSRPWDLQIRHPSALRRILAQGSIGLGESYMDGWWECEQIDELISRVLRARLDEQIARPGLWLAALRARLFNLQSVARAWQVGRAHYDLGNDLYEAMLDPYMAYSCGYWANAQTLEQAQEAKLDLACRKLGLRPGMRLLDIGCGWGSLMRFAAERYGAECVGLTISREQARWGAQKAEGLPVRFEFADYRQFNADGARKFDRIASIGMFEHVGHKNYRAYFAMARRSLAADGLFLLHTIGKNTSTLGIDPWIEKYIFPNGALPSVAEIATTSETDFVVEDWHNFGPDYDRTLMAWYARFEAAWPRLKAHYDERFRRMWRYYLQCCAGTFRARSNQLWQIVLSPAGIMGGYRRPLV